MYNEITCYYFSGSESSQISAFSITFARKEVEFREKADA